MMHFNINAQLDVISKNIQKIKYFHISRYKCITSDMVIGYTYQRNLINKLT